MSASRPLIRAHLMLHRRPSSVTIGDAITIDGCVLTTMTLLPHEQSEPFLVDFETATERLAELPQMYVEPDGSFVWVSRRGAEPAWQLDGVIADRADRVVSVEIKGSCPRYWFELLLGVFDWPDTPILVQLVQAAVFLETSEFFRYVDPP